MTKEKQMLNQAEMNADLVRRAYAAFNVADLDTLTAAFDSDASWHTPGRSPVAGDHVGRDATFTQFGRYGGETAGTFKAALQDVVAGADGRVIAMHHNSGERNGKQLDVDCCIVFDVTDGKITDGREYFYDLEAWDDFWA
jgi:ketosteroid isomerase-like protein